ncbi:MAG: UDP-3-O-acyl-N-acetylglucosamine deacetylase, partial [Candidatus Marinimicrobia bacterium]|nr:UDP-3-O-acyl-N-acetylglucosamine deacetylase [Candidatus Neomarinimicrobiota bacterium]
QKTLKRSVVLYGSGLHKGLKTGLILQPLPPESGIIFSHISSGQTIFSGYWVGILVLCR